MEMEMENLLNEIDALINNMVRYEVSETDIIIWIFLPWFIRANTPPRITYQRPDMACNLK